MGCLIHKTTLETSISDTIRRYRRFFHIEKCNIHTLNKSLIKTSIKNDQFKSLKIKKSSSFFLGLKVQLGIEPTSYYSINEGSFEIMSITWNYVYHLKLSLSLEIMSIPWHYVYHLKLCLSLEIMSITWNFVYPLKLCVQSLKM